MRKLIPIGATAIYFVTASVLGQQSSPNLAFVESIIHCLKLVRETKGEPSLINKPSTEKEGAFMFALQLERIGKEVQQKMSPWTKSNNPRIQEVARDTLAQFAGCRVRWAEAVAELKGRKPVGILRVVFCYLYFDHQGRLDRDKVMKNGVLMTEPGMGNIGPTKSGSVRRASARVAFRRRNHEAI